MKVINIHKRVLDAHVEQVGRLIDGLSSVDDPLWPIDRWPPMRFDRSLGVGATGGHGPIRYNVESYEPGRKIQFRFTKPDGFDGVHRFETEPAGEGKTILQHVIDMQTIGLRAMCTWAIIRPLHDALMEDALDRAERFLGKQLPLRKLSLWVKIVRWIMRRKRRG